MNHKEVLKINLENGSLPPNTEQFFQELSLLTPDWMRIKDFAQEFKLLDLHVTSKNIDYVASALTHLGSVPKLKDIFFRYSLKFAIKLERIDVLSVLVQHSFEHMNSALTNQVFGVDLQFTIPVKDMIAITKSGQFGFAATELLSNIHSSYITPLIRKLVFQTDLESLTKQLMSSEFELPIHSLREVALSLIDKGMSELFFVPTPETFRFVALARFLGFKEPSKPCDLYKSSFPSGVMVERLKYLMSGLDIISNLDKRIKNNYFASSMIADFQNQLTEFFKQIPEDSKSSLINYYEHYQDFEFLNTNLKQSSALATIYSIPNFCHTTEKQQYSLIGSVLGFNQADNIGKLSGCLAAISLFNKLVAEKPASIHQKFFSACAANLAVYVGRKVSMKPNFCFELNMLASGCFSTMFSHSKYETHLSAGIFDDFGAGYIFEKVIKSSTISPEAAGLQNEDLMQL